MFLYVLILLMGGGGFTDKGHDKIPEVGASFLVHISVGPRDNLDLALEREAGEDLF